MISDKPKIIFFLQDLLAGGAQRHTVNLADEMRDDFHPLLMPHASGVSESIVKESQIKDIRFLNEKGLLNPLKLAKISQSVAKEKPNLLITINQIATIIAIFGKLTGIIRCPVVSIFHSTEIKNVAGWIRTIPYIASVRFCAALVYISSNQQMIWNARRLSAKRNILIRNGINVSGFNIPSDIARRDARNELGFRDTEFVIGCLAALRYEKNHIQLIEALSQLRANGVSAKLLLVGDGPKRQEIQTKVNQLGMAAHVHLAGDQREVHRFISAMDVGVLTSLSIETLSLAALETMAMGVPMVMSDIGGASEIITEGKDGYLFPAGDTAKLIEKLKLCANPSHARMLGENAARKVREEFDHQKMCDAYRNLFHELIAESKAKKIRTSQDSITLLSPTRGKEPHEILSMTAKPKSKPVVVIYRHTLGKASEPWVWAQSLRYQSFEPVFLCREQVGPVGNGEFRVIEFGKKFQGRSGRLYHALRAHPSYAMKALKEAGIKPDVIHAYFAFDAVYASEISKKLRIPLVATLLGIDVSASNLTLITSGNASWVKLLFYRESLGKRTAIFQCVSQFLCKSAGHYYQLNKIKKGFLGIDESQFDFSEVTEEKVVLHIGRLVEKKGTIYLLKAFEMVLKEEPKAKLIIVGDGPLGPELKAWIASHHLSESVKMIPKASREEIASLLKKCRLFCLPSVTAANGDTEGLPVAVTEAMAVGRPVISTWHAGIPEAIEDGKSGYLVPERDVDALAARIEELLGNLERCRAMGAEGRRTVETRFSLAACAQETEKIYKEVLEQFTSPF